MIALESMAPMTATKGAASKRATITNDDRWELTPLGKEALARLKAEQPRTLATTDPLPPLGESARFMADVRALLLQNRYLEFDVSTAEVQRTIETANGSPVAFVAKENRDLTTLFTHQTVFVDVDLANPATERAAALAKLHRFVAINPEFGFRVYCTAGGLRYLVTSHVFAPSDPMVADMFQQLGACAGYSRACKRQNLFGARLEPKTQRLGGYAAGGFAVCQFLWHEGNPIIHPTALLILKVHDRDTDAHSGKPLA